MSRAVITPEFLRHVRHEGQLARAAARLRGAYEPLAKMSTWGLVCEEIVDTEYEPPHYERVVAELFRRGITPAELEEMRVFAWETAGWLNFEKMAWDWCSLDERDIQYAIEWQHREGEITVEECSRRLAYTAKHVSNAAP